MSAASSLPGLTIRPAAAAIRSGELRPSALVAAALDRIDRTEPRLRAWVEVAAKSAQAAAEATEAELARGIDRGPLHGIPVAVKDIIDVAGLPTRCGSRLLADAALASEDAPVVARLRAAGAVIMGKTVTQEFAAGVLSPPARNPWDPERSPGGSSGGSAVAVAVGAGLLALGSDTGGSIRIPAAAVGVCGFKPAYGALPTAGVAPLAPSLDTVGPLARTIDDLWLGWNALQGRLGDWSALPAVDPKACRIGVPRAFFRERLMPGVAAAFAAAAEGFARLGVDVVEVDWKEAARARAAAFVINRAETGESVWPFVAGSADGLAMLNPDLRVRVVAGRVVPSAAMSSARRARLAARDSVAALFGENRLHALLAPTLPSVAVPAGDPVVRYPDGTTEGVGVAHTRLTMPFNATGQPVIAMPCGFGEHGLPVGLQLAGRPGDEDRLFALAAQWEAALGWTGFAPPDIGAAS